MKKTLTEDQLACALERANVGDQTKEIARGVLVLGFPQSRYVKMFNLTRGAVSQAVKRVLSYHDSSLSEDIPDGYEKVTAILPSHRAYIVKRWEKETEIIEK